MREKTTSFNAATAACMPAMPQSFSAINKKIDERLNSDYIQSYTDHSSRRMKLSNIKPISYLKSDAARIVTELSESHEPLVITQNGEAKLVVQDIASYEAQQQTMALLKILALGQKEVELGKTTSAMKVFADLDRLDDEAGE